MRLSDLSHKFVGRFRPLFTLLLQAIARLRSCIPLPFSIFHVLPPCLRHQNLKGKRRALLIGISKSVETNDPVAGSSETSEDGLKGPHKEAEAMGALLRDKYGYSERDIKYLLDRPGYEYPTRKNILREMKELMKNAKEGDRFFFHYSGHSDQEETTDPEEDDGMNEYILSCLNEKIMDDYVKELKICLVESLPPGCCLTAIFDSCHSGTLLDLPHYRCNRIHLPFENKGTRRTMQLWRNLVRKQAMSPQSVEGTSRRLPIPRRQRSISMSRVPLSEAEQSLYQISNGVSRQIHSINTNVERSIASAVCDDSSRWCVSPDEDHEYCDGFGCAEGAKDDGPGPDVICISSSGDGQETWEDPDGSSVTAELIKIFTRDQHPLLSQVMSTISLKRHEAFRALHDNAVKYREERRFRRLKKKQRSRPSDFNPEMVNFQIPQLSSLKRLPWNQQWDP
ncbi:hypothetical protein NLJ89_g9217 [Agrocybe chaxingu]|uniref:Peptidase C14 caspase domain-containing protein n=1 Tax=Agrocybe chaxingu TaxID=84603 RepID=A0A9W8MTR7_9AGAR|nr:hypothetical protein NLJ89_g9217 [Agrocybe chaxingu]